VITDEFTTSELRFRLFRMIRPVYRFPSGDKLVCHGLSISDGSRTAEITDSEQQTLELLLRAGEQEVPRAALLAILTRSGRLTKHGLPAEARTSRALDMHVSRLRAKLLTVAGAWAAPLRITAVRGGGYRLSQSEQIPYHQVVDNS
jgi:DNA-binding response OmpR family regulator